MPCETKQKEIQGRKYTVTQMPATVSVPLQVRLIQILGAAVVPILQDLKKVEGVDTGMAAIGKAVGGLGEAIEKYMPPDQFLAFAKQLTDGQYVGEGEEGHPLDFDLEFSGDDLVRLYPVMAFVLEVNYASLFTGSELSGLLGLAKAKYQSVVSKESPPISPPG